MEDLHIYQNAIQLTAEIYQLINQFPSLKRDFALNDQLRRAAISVAANIAEGTHRSLKHNKNYLAIASGSANEVVILLKIVHEVYQRNTSTLQEKYRILGKQINAFSKSLR